MTTQPNGRIGITREDVMKSHVLHVAAVKLMQYAALDKQGVPYIATHTLTDADGAMALQALGGMAGDWQPQPCHFYYQQKL